MNEISESIQEPTLSNGNNNQLQEMNAAAKRDLK